MRVSYPIKRFYNGLNELVGEAFIFLFQFLPTVGQRGKIEGCEI